MKKQESKLYFFCILRCGDDSPEKISIEATSELDAFRQVYINLIGYDTEDEYMEDCKEDPEMIPYNKISKKVVMSAIYQDEDIVEFLLDCSTGKLLFDYDGC